MLDKIISIFKKTDTKTPMPSGIKPVVLLILDGYGLAPPSEGNAISLAKRPNIESYYASYPHGKLIASGESVGLPANEVGNTEVGHLTLGAGRVIDQDLVRINKSLKEGSFYDKPAFLYAMDHSRKYNSKIHIMGLIGSGNVHSSMEHFWGLMEFCRKNKLNNIYLHLFTDGRDSSPEDGVNVVEKIEGYLAANKVGQIATLMGRYFGMDRDRRWDRTRLAYEALIASRGYLAKDPSEALKKSYLDGKTDEFIEPIIIVDESGKPKGQISDNDSAIFFNFRIDRPRELTMAFTMADFETLKKFDFGKDPERGGRKEGEVELEETFKRIKVLKNLYFVTMTEYHNKLPVSSIAFPKIVVEDTVSEVVSKQGLKQSHLAESEKERFVTYYFNGQREEKYKGEDDIIVPSPKVATYDKTPEMSVAAIVSEFKKNSNYGKYSFFVINFANCDMVAHTGNIAETVKACESVDRAVGELVNWTLALGGTVVITADHGNAEELLTYPTTSFFITTEKGQVDTEHSNNPVPLILINSQLKGNSYNLPDGSLKDVAPTILALMGIPKPPTMTGNNLLHIG